MAHDGEGRLLDIADVTIAFGGVTALKNVNCHVEPEEILGLIGPNGAGKTTLFNVVTRLYSPDSGRIEFQGQDLRGARPNQVVGLGIARTFQHAVAVPGLSVVEQVMLACFRLGRASWLTAPIGVFNRRDRERAHRVSMDALAEVGLANHAGSQASVLPLGLLKRLDLARALVVNPELVLLDEPANGLTHDEVDELGGILRQIRSSRNIAMVLVEHHMGLVMSLCDRLVVLNLGQTIAEGLPDAVAKDPAVIAAYMGESVS